MFLYKTAAATAFETRARKGPTPAGSLVSSTCVTPVSGSTQASVPVAPPCPKARREVKSSSRSRQPNPHRLPDFSLYPFDITLDFTIVWGG